ncbi:MAG: helix-turn-helix transcriptional regulator [Eubacteriales bacterium]|nr:helix-turn-helix transcriptional regulator [Eubacteriales bacterium]
MYYDAAEFGRRLRALRQGRNLTQEQLGEELNINFSRISRLESGRCTPSIDALVEIAVFFEVSLDYLVLGKKAEKENIRGALLQISEGLKAMAMNL